MSAFASIVLCIGIENLDTESHFTAVEGLPGLEERWLPRQGSDPIDLAECLAVSAASSTSGVRRSAVIFEIRIINGSVSTIACTGAHAQSRVSFLDGLTIARELATRTSASTVS